MATPISGTRWYRAFPTPLTKLVVADANTLWTGADPNAVYPYTPLTAIQNFTGQNANAPVTFAAARDPALNNGSGGDILIICGFTGPYGFGTGAFTLTGTPVQNQTIILQFVNGATTVTLATYTTLQTDSLASISKNLTNLINSSAAVTPGAPFLNQAVVTSSSDGSTYKINLYALNSGVGGNAITYKATLGGPAGFTITPTMATNLTGGGAMTSAPLKYDGATVSGLSGQITNAFTGCVSWHDHVWYWGDSQNPDSLYASDIDQPEGFSFMIQQGPYEIGAGDGDPSIRAGVPLGNILYAFKSNSIYAVTGYDFQTGEYEFSIEPAIQGHGTPNSESVAVLNNKALFWDGHAFYQLRPGSFDVEHIGRTIPLTEGLIAKGNSLLVRAVAGSFVVESLLNESYGTPGTEASEIYSSVAYFAVDIGNGIADTVLVYDEDATNFLGNYAWSVWTGWQVGCWIPFGGGPSVSGVAEEAPVLCWGQDIGGKPQISAYGTDPTGDNGYPISWIVQTGWLTLQTGALVKLLHRLFLEMEATPGVNMSATVTPSVMVEQNGNLFLQAAALVPFASTGGQKGAQAHQTLIAQLQPFLKAPAWMIGLGENSATSSFEIVEVTIDFVEEAFAS